MWAGQWHGVQTAQNTREMGSVAAHEQGETKDYVWMTRQGVGLGEMQ